MTELKVGVVDVHVILTPPGEPWKVLGLQRASNTRCPSSWEAVHGRIEDGEKPEDAAIREVHEETGLAVARLYNVTVQPFYLHAIGTVQVAIVFAAFVDAASVRLGAEHQAYAWLSVSDAMQRLAWPREREALEQIVRLLGTGDAGAVEDVLRVR